MTSVELVEGWGKGFAATICKKKIVELYIYLAEKHEHWNTMCVISSPHHAWPNMGNAVMMWHLEKEGQYLQQLAICDKKFVELFKCPSEKLNIEIQRALPSPAFTETKKKKLMMTWPLSGPAGDMEKFVKLFKSSARQFGKLKYTMCTLLRLLLAKHGEMDIVRKTLGVLGHSSL